MRCWAYALAGLCLNNVNVSSEVWTLKDVSFSQHLTGSFLLKSCAFACNLFVNLLGPPDCQEWALQITVDCKKRIQELNDKIFVCSLCSSSGLLTLRLPHLKGVWVSRVTQHIIQSMKHRHPYPSLVKSNPRCHSSMTPPDLVFMVTLYCSTVLWNLGKCFIRVHVSSRAACSRWPLAFVVSRRADALRILCRKSRLIQTWVMTRSNENADKLILCCSTVFYSPP